MSVMKKEEILNEHIWVMPLHAILRVLDKLPGVIMCLIFFLLVFLVLYVVLFMIPFFCVISFTNYFSSAYGFGEKGSCILMAALFVSWITSLIISFSYKPIKKHFDKLSHWVRELFWDRISFLLHCNPNLSGRLLQYYEKRGGVIKRRDTTNEETKNHNYHKGVQSERDKSNSHLLPFVSRLCQLNKNAREEQKTFLSEFFNEDEIRDAFNKRYSDEQTTNSYRYWRGRELREKKALMELLFKFTIVEDGIHNDEWYMLIQIMTQLKFGKRDIEYFKNRYSSLRTEFDDYKRKKTSSKVKKPNVNLNPYYAILELKEGASIEEIKRAYHNLALKHHPDLPKNAGKIKECEEMMKKINEAYEKLRG